jgi:hydroxyethylthiazole kinase-like uncharacterized protein yjeF
MDSQVLNLTSLLTLLPQRERDAHKGDFGHTLIVGGDYGMAGAVRLAAEACARVGSGLTTVATRAEHINIVSGARPEIMCYGINHVTQLKNLLTRATVLVLGTGLGQSDWSQELFHYLIAISSQPKIIDADGLNLLAKQPQYREDWILTPHVGEAARLLQSTSDQIQKNRIAAIKEIQKKYGGVVVLKGKGSLVTRTNEDPSICEAGNPGMASGGMGDVLSGVIGGLVAQGLSLQQAAELGVCVHAAAGDRAAKENGERGLLALDLIPYIRELLK